VHEVHTAEPRRSASGGLRHAGYPLVPWLTKRFGNARLLAAGLAVAVIGMAWLSRLSADGPCPTTVALPMVLIGLGQGAALGPLTASGIAGVAGEDAGAASGVVNVAHQLGGSLGLGIMVTVFAAVQPGTADPRQLLAHRIGDALTAGTVMLTLALALAVVVALIVRVRAAADALDSAPAAMSATEPPAPAKTR